MPRPRAVLFDIDGTLIDSNLLHVDVWQMVFAEVGARPSRDEIHGQIGKGGDNLVPTLLPDADDATRERTSERHGEIFKTYGLHRARPFPRAAELLARVHAAGQQVVLASSAKRAELDHYVGVLGATDLVAHAVTMDDVERSKPAGDIFATALARTGLPAAEVIAVGDTPYDATSAAKCGVATVGLLSGGFTADELTGAGVVALYADVAALLADYDGSPLATGG